MNNEESNAHRRERYRLACIALARVVVNEYNDTLSEVARIYTDATPEEVEALRRLEPELPASAMWGKTDPFGADAS